MSTQMERNTGAGPPTVLMERNTGAGPPTVLMNPACTQSGSRTGTAHINGVEPYFGIKKLRMARKCTSTTSE